jgi:hypothetical protein
LAAKRGEAGRRFIKHAKNLVPLGEEFRFHVIGALKPLGCLDRAALPKRTASAEI